MESRPPRRSARDARDARDARGAGGAQEARDARDGRARRDSRDSRDGRAGWAALLLRLAVGATFVAHGLQKVWLLGWERGVQMLGDLGFAFAEVAYPLAVAAEIVGGSLLVLGIWVRPAAVALTGVMVGAILVVHLPHGFFLPMGLEYALNMIVANAALILLGPGHGSLEAWRRTSRRGVEAG